MPAIPTETATIHPIPEINNILLGKINLSTADLTHSIFSKIFNPSYETDIPLAAKVESLNSLAFGNLIDYLNAYIRFNGKIEGSDLKNLLRLFHKGIIRFSGNSQFDESACKNLNSLTKLFSGISRRYFPDLIHDQTANFQQLGHLLGKLIKNSGNNSRYGTHDFLLPYFNAARSLIDNPTMLTHGYYQISESIVKLGEDCLSVQKCDHIPRLSEIFSTLGEMTARLQNKTYATSTIRKEALQLMAKAAKQLTENEQKKLAFEYVLHAESGKSLEYIHAECARLFTLPDCDYFSEPTIATSTSTASPNSTLSTSPLLPTEQTEVTTLATPSSTTDITEENTTIHLSTHTESPTPETTPASDNINALPATAAFGFLTGATAETIDQLPNHNMLWKFAKIILSVPLPILNAYLVNLVQNVDNPEEALNVYNLLISCSMVLGIKVFLPIADTLVKKYDLETYVKPAVLPIGLSLYTLWQNPLAGSVNYVSAVAGMLSVRGLKKGINSTWNFFTKNLPENNIPLNPREEDSSTESTSAETQISVDSEESPLLPDLTKFCHFIQKDKFNELKESFAKLLLALNTINDFYKDEIELLNKLKIKTTEITINLEKYNSTITLINSKLTILQELAGCLKEERHLDACVHFTNTQELVNKFNSKDENGRNSALQTLHGLFGSIQTHMNMLPKTLSEIKGIDCAAKLADDSETALKNAPIATKLTYAIQKVEGILGIIGQSLSDYNTKNAACIREKNTSVEGDTINKNPNHQNRRHTFYTLSSTTDSSDYRTSSTTDRSSSSNQSDPDSLPEDNENHFLIRH